MASLTKQLVGLVKLWLLQKKQSSKPQKSAWRCKNIRYLKRWVIRGILMKRVGGCRDRRSSTPYPTRPTNRRSNSNSLSTRKKLKPASLKTIWIIQIRLSWHRLWWARLVRWGGRGHWRRMRRGGGRRSLCRLRRRRRIISFWMIWIRTTQIAMVKVRRISLLFMMRSKRHSLRALTSIFSKKPKKYATSRVLSPQQNLFWWLINEIWDAKCQLKKPIVVARLTSHRFIKTSKMSGTMPSIFSSMRKYVRVIRETRS